MRSPKSVSISLRCSESQKLQLEHQARLAGARSLSDYALKILTQGQPDDFAFVRRKAEGPLLNAEAYERLGKMVAILQECPDLGGKMIQDLIREIQEMRKDIAIRRLQMAMERHVD